MLTHCSQIKPIILERIANFFLSGPRHFKHRHKKPIYDIDLSRIFRDNFHNSTWCVDMRNYSVPLCNGK